MSKERRKIPFKLVAVSTEEFATIEANYPKELNPKLEIALDVRFRINPDNPGVGCYVKNTFTHQDDIVLLLECACHFAIERNYWNEQIDGQVITLSKSLLTHLIVLTVGTTRGVIHAKKPKWFKGILPTLNVSSILTEDVSFDLTKSDEEE